VSATPRTGQRSFAGATLLLFDAARPALGVSKRSPNRDNAAELGVSKESPNPARFTSAGAIRERGKVSMRTLVSIQSDMTKPGANPPPRRKLGSKLLLR